MQRAEVYARALRASQNLRESGGIGGRAMRLMSGRGVSEVHKHLVALNIDTALARGSRPSAGEAERSGKREYCAAFNEALSVQQRLPRGGE